ncbi:helix-turn-helix transcriptional regulator [Priestia megaterium]|uniref:helix-turn-helix domain-containing protein n=1 Tax=Priestia megaterium TaxID=1404 RepID=UPI002E1D886D|nr:helix-turn-helix transcriptional regulator [Priestia megaterium]
MNKKNLNAKHKRLMDLLDEVPGVKEHMDSLQVQMGKKILKRRLELGMTQKRLAEIICENGEKITQATISKVECGETSVESDTYSKIFNALGGLKNLDIEFGEYPQNGKKEPALV